jgi:23S rRNA (uridine2552-2'-O)-methyltransferase
VSALCLITDERYRLILLNLYSVKFFAHPLLDQFRDERLKPNFNQVHYIKPDSSRATSREGYFFCQGWDPM